VDDALSATSSLKNFIIAALGALSCGKRQSLTGFEFLEVRLASLLRYA